MKLSAFHPFVLPWVRHLPDETVQHHVRQAAIDFCARTGVWHEEMQPVLTIANIDRYAAAIDADARLAKLITCWVGDKECEVVQGPEARTRARRGSPRDMAWTDREDIVLVPAPQEAGKQIVGEIALKPTDECTELPDVLDEFKSDIAYGALSTLLLLPGESANDKLASINQGKFERRIAVVSTRVSRGFSSARIRTGSTQFY